MELLNLMGLSTRSFLNISLRKHGSALCSKGAFTYYEDSYSLHINRDNKKFSWIITIERFECFKVIVISFHQKSASNAKGIKKFSRNKGDKCIDPLISLVLFKEIFELAINRYESYAFCFYALDDALVLKREDMNKRMSAFTKFIQRDNIASKHAYKIIGNLHDSLYLGYNSKYCTEEEMLAFIEFYKPILFEEIKQLFSENGNSQKL